jgi:8-oxo-dGTP diphosphatase
MKKDRPKIAEIKMTTDVVIFTVDENELKVLLLYRDEEPFLKKLALPGGFIWEDETSNEAGRRILKSKTNVDNFYFEQLYTFDNPKRDPRERIATVAYFALVPKDKLDSEVLSQNTVLKPVGKTKQLAFDHSQILSYAAARLRSKLAYSNIAYSLLPKHFSLQELQNVYEVILGKTLDKRNFRKKIQSLELIEPTEIKQTGTRHRPAMLYQFKQHSYTELDEPFLKKNN